MIGAGTFISPLIKVITTVAILAAVYFFIVKPSLDATKDISDRALESFGEIPGLDDNSFDAISPQIQQSIRQAQRLTEQQAQASSQQVQEANKLIDCITDADGNVNKINVCNQRFSP